MECNNKTHHRFWINDIQCPVCYSAAGYTESIHGGLSEQQIDSKHSEYVQRVRRVEGDTRSSLYQVISSSKER